MSNCRCGWDGNGEHLCHRCHKKPGAIRFLTHLTCLSGAQMKLGARDTHACDACWTEFLAEVKEAALRLSVIPGA